MKIPRRGSNRILLKIDFTCQFLEEAAVKIERREGRVERRKGGRGGRKKITMYLNSGNTVKF